MTENISNLVKNLRETIYVEFKAKLENSPSQTIENINVRIPCDIDEDNYHVTIIKSAFLDGNGNILLSIYDEIDDVTDTDDFSAYSIDEMLKIVSAI